MKTILFKIPAIALLLAGAMACKKSDKEDMKPYVPMIVAGNQWNELCTNGSVAPEYQYQRTSVTVIGDDTLIDGRRYYKLLTAQDSLSEQWVDNGCIREDATQRKVYYKPAGKPELVLYAFGLKVGDVITTFNFRRAPDDMVSNTVVDVETVRMNAVEREKITICLTGEDDPFYRYTWIEGIGGVEGLLNSYIPIAPGGSTYMLLCFFQHGELVYKPADTGVSDCFVWRYINR
ncbi:MAG: hypothetical protein LBF90_01935 [Prevotellaceae bacterium]|jgi:hypothetical protein|nr:hypothetical protein [Prevotellaceae bacterium]